MNRSLLITVHMYLAAFFAVFVLLVSISGGLYLLGVKGSMARDIVHTASGAQELSAVLKNEEALNIAVVELLAEAGVEDYSFEYVKVKGNTLYTRPTSRTHYVIELQAEISVTRSSPSLQAALMELHMGHGPGAFKTFQKVFALGLIFIIMSGLWLGLSSERLRLRTLTAAGIGLLAFLAAVSL